MFVKAFWLVTVLVVLGACGSEERRPLSMNALYENPDASGFATADKVLPIEFPRDHGEHLDFQTEWWYLVGIVADESQREFGFQFTLFRQALTPTESHENDWRTGQIYMAHFAISDVAASNHIAYERFSRGHEHLAGVSTAPFKAFLEDWVLRSVGKSFAPLHLRTQAKGYALDLTIDATKAPVLHGEDGLSWKSATNASYYYSIPRMQTSGTLSTPDQSYKVNGYAWLDREWSTGILNPNYQGWNWLTLHLDDGRDLVLFNLVPKTNDVDVMPVGMLVEKDGNRIRLSPDEWHMNPTRYWRSWPIDWELKLRDQSFTIEAAFDDQLMSTSVRYWEGVVFAFDDDQRVGTGYLELTGY
ncbi:MAG: carotenoid 1,2-hydratase [Gammaproteobacteria bacterium]|nr:carotenoid 1,2-hydratase [Gammaproteobacteria bacterium]